MMYERKRSHVGENMRKSSENIVEQTQQRKERAASKLARVGDSKNTMQITNIKTESRGSAIGASGCSCRGPNFNSHTCRVFHSS